jgi:hypothetical protein
VDLGRLDPSPVLSPQHKEIAVVQDDVAVRYCFDCVKMGSWDGAASAYLELSEFDKIELVARVSYYGRSKADVPHEWHLENLQCAVRNHAIPSR